MTNLEAHCFGSFCNTDHDSASLSTTQELILIIANDQSDITHLEKLRDIQSRIRALRQEHMLHLKHTVQETSEEAQSQEERVVRKDSIDNVAAEEERVKQEIKAAEQHLDSLLKKNNELKANIQKLVMEQDKLDAEYDKVCKETTQSLPFARQQVKVYNTITNVRWNLDCEPNKIEGYVANKDNVKPFSLDSTQVSKFFITNYLWDLIDEDW